MLIELEHSFRLRRIQGESDRCKMENKKTERKLDVRCGDEAVGGGVLEVCVG